MNRNSMNLLQSNLARSAVDHFEKLVRWKWRKSRNLSRVESILDDLDYQSKHSNQPYSETELNRYWWWYVSGWVNATRSKISAPESHIFRVKFFNEAEVELSGKAFTEYCNARKNVDVEYIDVLYHRGRFNSKGAAKKFLCDELELNDGEVNSGGWF